MKYGLRNLCLGSAVLAAVSCGSPSPEAPAQNQVDTLRSAITGRICPAGTTVEGIDVSMYQGSITWSSVKGAGIAFAITRIGDGSYQDPTFATNWAGIKAAGLIRGAYQYFEPGQDAIAQANIVIAKVGRLGTGDLPVMLDVEATGGQSAATITAHIHQWVDAVTAGTGKVPFIYTGAYFWDDNIGSADFAGLPLNIAWYGTNCPGLPNSWHGWAFHQYSSTGKVSGIAGNVDQDVFNGTLAQLQAFAGNSPAVNPDLYFVNREAGTGSTEVHALSAGAAFKSFSVHATSGIGKTGTDGSWQFLLGDYNRDGVKDVYAISKRGGSGHTEVHVLDGAAGYKTFLLHSATPQATTGTDNTYSFALGDWDKDGIADLFMIQGAGTGTGMTEVHVLSGASDFHTWILHTATLLAPVGTGAGWKFLVGDYDHDGAPDLYALSKNGGSHTTEVHVLAGSAQYKTWLLHATSALPVTGTDFAWDFALADRDGDGALDLYAISKTGTGTGTTELHILSGAAGSFKTWLLHTGTALSPTGSDQTWQFSL